MTGAFTEEEVRHVAEGDGPCARELQSAVCGALEIV